MAGSFGNQGSDEPLERAGEPLERAGEPSSRALAHKMPQLLDFAERRGAPTRLPRLYGRLARSCSSINGLFHAWGTTEEERAMSFPCDSYVSLPQLYYHRGIEVLAPREIVYRWLCQLRVAPYAYDWFDNYGRQSPRRLTPGVEQLRPGQRMLVMFKMVECVENEQITMRSARFERFFGEVALTYRVLPRGVNSCRIVTKLTGHDTGSYAWRLRRDYFPIGELPLMHKQLRTFKHLAERQFLEELAGGRRVQDTSCGDRQRLSANGAGSMGELVTQPPHGD
jgi:hypothetical protein